MKICPACQQTYSDDSLNFCLSDGSVLTATDRQQANARQTVGWSAAQTQPFERRAQVAADAPPKSVRSTNVLFLAAIVCTGFLLLCIAAAVYLQFTRESTNKNVKPAAARPIQSASQSVSDEASSVSDDSSRRASTPIQNAKTVLTLSDYNRLKNGISYKEAVALVGSSGVEVSSAEAGGYKTATYKWEGDDYAFLYLVFQNDKLISKTQNNLK